MKRTLTYITIAAAILASCKKNAPGDTGTNDPNITKIAPDGFNFATSKNVSVDITLRASNDDAIAGVVVNIFTPGNLNSDQAIFKGVTDKSGNLKATVSVPAYLNKIVIDPAYTGLLRNVTAGVNNGATTVVIGGKNSYSGDVIPDAPNSVTGTGNLRVYNGSFATSSVTYVYPSPYTGTSDAVLNTATYPLSVGRPKYLLTTPDVIDASTLSYINASLPEGTPVTTSHPAYLSSTATQNINVTATSDIFVTFVSEGAGYQSSLGYYTYPTANPPSSSSAIGTVTMVFPNCSGSGSGGALKAGDKVKLGTFNAGTTIAFVLLQNAWTGSGVSTGAQKFYTDAAFNPESNSTLKKHAITLYDDVHNLYLTGFEDLNRQDASTNPSGYSSDNDFNDLVFYTTSSVNNSISNSGVSAIDKGGDSDGDGVPDVSDAFPNDATRAYISYFPSQTSYAYIAFEDNWPQKGDYDMNDLVVKYRYTFVKNAQNQVVTMQGDYSVAAAGAQYKNGFGVQLPVAASAVASVTGQRSSGSYIQFASNNVEAGQTNAVIIPFDNTDALVQNPGGAFFINTLMAKDKVTSDVASVLVTFTTPVAQSTLTVASLNPFLISNLRRGYEVHLPGYAPTAKADTKLFGTYDDVSNTATGKYYLSKENWPWAISFNEAFSYPVETVNITQAYTHFSAWALSGGISYPDWYSNTASDYRNTANIYSK